MSRTNTYASLRAECRNTSVDIGGRGRNNWISGWFNTATGDGEVSLSLKTEVVGTARFNDGNLRKSCRNCGHKYGDDYGKIKECPECQITRQGIDTRHAHFTIEMPEATNMNHTVHIRQDNAAMGDLARFGAGLVAMKGYMLEASPEPDEIERGQHLLEQAGEIIEDLETKISDYGNVVVDTPMGKLNLKYLIACTQYAEIIRSQGDED